MATIKTRAGEGRVLTNTEVDANFTNLNNGKLEVSGDTITGSIIVDQASSGNIVYKEAGGVYIPRPLGGSFVTSATDFTGACTIKLPTVSSGQSDMLSFWVDIFDYAGTNEGESVSLYIYGYQYSTNLWNNTGALVFSDRTDRDYTVRFGHDGTRPVVHIGETTTAWNYPQVTVKDFQAGYNADYTKYAADWDVTFETSYAATISQTSTANYPVAKSALRWTTGRTITLTGDVTGTSGTWDGSGNISFATVVGNDSHSHAFNNLTAKTSGTGTYQTTGDFIADNFEATGLGPNATPGSDDAYFGGYGILGDRGTFYVSNVSGAVALNHNAVHGSNIKLVTTSTGVTVTGLLTATQKSFTIDHPTQEGKKLRYGSLEGPENGVYVRGRLKGDNTIELPEYWTELVHEDSITVQLTANGSFQKLYVRDIKDNKVVIANGSWFNNDIDCFYVVYGERKDVDKLVTEFEA